MFLHKSARVTYKSILVSVPGVSCIINILLLLRKPCSLSSRNIAVSPSYIRHPRHEEELHVLISVQLASMFSCISVPLPRTPPPPQRAARGPVGYVAPGQLAASRRGHFRERSSAEAATGVMSSARRARVRTPYVRLCVVTAHYVSPETVG